MLRENVLTGASLPLLPLTPKQKYMELQKIIRDNFTEAQEVLKAFLSDDKNIESIAAAATMMAKSIQQGGKIISCGNGGSMCDAMHFAEELSGKFREERRPLPAIAVSDPSHIS